MFSFLINNFIRITFSIVGILFPSTVNLVVFGSKHGSLYCDNSKYLFEWVLKNKPEINCIWLTRKKEVEDLLKKNNIPCLNMYSLKGRLALRHALVGVISHSLRDIAPKPEDIPNSIKLVQLFHGQCVKAVRFGMNEGFDNNNEAIERELEAKRVSCAISTSKFMLSLWDQCMGFGKEKYIVTGFPRNDCLIEIPEENNNNWNRYINGEIIENIILYAPTYRPGNIPTEFFPFKDYKKELLLSLLDKTKSHLLLRPHLTDQLKYEESRYLLNDLDGQRRIKFATYNEFSDINTFLPFVDILVTDYSSIYHDYLLLNKPMIFIPYDYNDYNKRSGFIYDYFNNLPGPAVNSFNEFSEQILSIISGLDNYSERRNNLNHKIHKYSDANSCERVSKILSDLIT